ncbi:hypothetical protein SAMN04488540_11413 [Ferrimonas sediminum]|uniref:Lipoprotein n=1 Tax=Ferrimonas sediminum TaxID=718193 RepID=A0A1G8WV23_9GAMM|nr:hypothetical protein [Ferrimonas sediminum]SDJ82252.1 hypothetical protein SAMN04488540_11413 [Ferrimonas sediminum]
MKNQNGFKLCALVAAMVALAGCGSDSDSSPTPVEPELYTGVFLDSPVAGLSFATDTQQGVTNAAGEFVYQEGEQVNFSLGATEFPVVDAAAEVTPLTLFATEDATTPEVVNTLRLLQSLDSDGNPENGITITAEVAQAMPSVTLDEGTETFETQMTSALDAVGMEAEDLVSSEEALDHFDETVNPGFTAADLEGNWVSFEFLTPRFGYNSPDSFDYRLADWIIGEGELTVKERNIAGEYYPDETYDITMDTTGRITVDEETEMVQMDTGEQMMLWWSGEQERQRIATSAKRADEYALADLEGEWLVGSVYTPSRGNGDPGAFGYGVYHLAIDAEGLVSFTDLGETDSDVSDQFNMTVNETGRVRVDDDEEDESYLQLSAHKDLLIQVAVWGDGEQEFMVGVKQPETLEMSKMAGQWYAVGIEVPESVNDANLFSYDLDEVVIDSTGAMKWHHKATDDNEADLTVVDDWQLELRDGMFRDADDSYWMVNASYTVAVNIYGATNAIGYAVLVRQE